jgi:N-acetylgalactosamine kinase
MKRPFVTIILAGGKGTRMGTSDKHKVCFEVLGVPVIIHALETYNLCGAMLNVVVVGSMAESVMATVTRRFPGTPYAFQDKPHGTGDAARKGAEMLERMRFDGNVLVVAGDKVIDPKVIRQLLAAHEQSGADVTLATARRPANSSAGILLKSSRGNIVGILEEAERRRLVALAKVSEAFRKETVLPRKTVEGILVQECGEKTARAVLGEIWPEASLKSEVQSPKSKVQSQKPEGGGNSPSPCPLPEERVVAGAALTREEFEKRFTREERQGCLKVGDEIVPVIRMLERFDQMNLSTYLFRAPVLYDALSRLKSGRSSQEDYLTDVFEILARRKKPARVVGCEMQDARDLMAFNNPQELLAIEEVYRQRQGQVAIMRSPGRINLMGRHIDHHGGTVNVMAVNREIIMVAAPRTRAVSSTLWRITGGTNFINPNSSRTAFAISRPSSSGQPAAINRNRVTVHIIRCQ